MSFDDDANECTCSDPECGEWYNCYDCTCELGADDCDDDDCQCWICHAVPYGD